MSSIKLSPNASGTGAFTIAAPNSNTNRTLDLPDAAGTFNISGAVNEVPAGSASAPSIYPTGDSNTGVFFPAADTIAFTEGGAEAARIDSSGNLLAGGTSVIYYSKVLSQFDGATKYGFVANDTSNASSIGFAAFSVNGTSTTGAIGSITRNGSASSVLYNTTSDERLKENIADADAALGTVAAIKVRKYDWKEGGQHEDYGFIAQELAEVVNNVVSKGRTEEDMWAVDYGKLTPLLCKAIQELNAKVDAQAAEIAALKGAK